MKNWKTTIAGLLSAFGMAVGPLSGLLASMQAIQAQIPGHGPADYTLAIWGAGLTCAAAIARGWIGLIQNDAPPLPPVGSTTTVTVPATPATTTTVVTK